MTFLVLDSAVRNNTSFVVSVVEDGANIGTNVLAKAAVRHATYVQAFLKRAEHDNRSQWTRLPLTVSSPWL